MKSFTLPAASGRIALVLGTTFLTSSLFAAPVLAQEDDTEVLLDTVVITAAGFEQSVKDAPASISVISGETLRKGNVTNLTDALKGVQGVAVTGISAEQDITIRGLPGQYTLILVDGKRQGTRESRPNGSSGWEQSFIPPVAAIERIEVVRGPMSSLYGADAVGGVINIITKPVSDVWSGSVTVEGTVPDGGKDGAMQQGSFYLSGPLVGDRLGLQVWGRRLNRDEAERIDGIPGATDRDIAAQLTWQMTETQSLALKASRSNITHDSTVGRNVAEGPTAINSTQRNIREELSLTHKADFGAVQTELSYTVENGRRTTWTGTDVMTAGSREPEVENRVLDGKFYTSYSAAGEHRMIGGFQLSEATVTDQSAADNNAVRDFGADQWAVFLEDEWAINDKFSLTLGLRYTDHERFGGHVTPRVYGVYRATEDLTIKGGVSTGFRAPDIRASTPGYYYLTQRGAGLIVPNPDLKPEESTNYEIGAQWAREGIDLGLTLFQTDFENKIENQSSGLCIDPPNPGLVPGGTLTGDCAANGQFVGWNYLNVPEATIRGVELTSQFALGSSLELRANYTYTDSEQKGGTYDGLPIMRTPEHMANIRLDWMTPVTGLDAWALASYHGSEINSGARIGTNGTAVAWNDEGTPIAFKYGAYSTLDLGVNYAVNDAVSLNAAVYNVTDRTTTSSSNNTVNEGRRLWLGVTATF